MKKTQEKEISKKSKRFLAKNFESSPEQLDLSSEYDPTATNKFVQARVLILGRPNVGKSKLFNTLTKSKSSIVFDYPGVTRDFLFRRGEFNEEAKDIEFIDSAGIDTPSFEKLNELEPELDMVLFVVDGPQGFLVGDREILNWLRKKEIPYMVLVNKLDHGADLGHMSEFMQIGAEEIIAVSAQQRRGLVEVLSKINEFIQDDTNGLKKRKRKHRPHGRKIALIGFVNVGKSSITNRIIGRSASEVSHIPGTTRDSVDLSFSYNSEEYLLLDTAGVRRRTKISEKIESLSVQKSFAAIETAEVLVLVLDATRGLNRQEMRLSQAAKKSYKPLIIIVNKWDLVEEKDDKSQSRWEEFIKIKYPHAPLIFMSATENRRVQKLLPLLEDVFTYFDKRVATSEVNRVLAEIVDSNPPALMRGIAKRPKFYYATQVASAPPKFVLQCNFAGLIKEDYKRYLSNQMRKRLDFKYFYPQLVFNGKKDQQRKVELRKNMRKPPSKN